MSCGIEIDLGLPSVENVRKITGDTSFADLYDEFIGGLHPYGSIITSNYVFFKLQDEKNSLAAAACLFACVLNSDNELITKLTGALFNIKELPVLGIDGKKRPIDVDFDNFTLDKLLVCLEDPEFRKDFFYCCWFGPSSGNQDVAVFQMRHFVAAPSTPEYQLFSVGRVKPSIDIEFRYFVGTKASGVERIRVVAVNDEWSAVLCSNLEIHIFPAFLGFIRRSDYAHSLVNLSKTVGDGTPFLAGVGGTIEWIRGLDRNDRIFVADLTRSEESCVLWPFISPLSKEERDQLLHEIGTFEEIEGILSEIHEIGCEGAKSLYPLDDNGTAQPLYDAMGRPTNKEWFKRIRDKLEEESEADYERSSPKNIPIGPELVERLDQWLDEMTASNGVEQMRFLAAILSGRGEAVIGYLRSNDSIVSRRVLNQINEMASRNFHHNPMAMVWNAPLKTVKREVLGQDAD